MTTKRLFAYYRISPTPRKNNPEENQRNIVRKYANENHLDLIQEFEDLQISGSDMDRPQFQLMLSKLNEADGIIIYDVSRFARNSKAGIPIFLQILNQKKLIVLVKNHKILDYSDNSEMSTWEMLIPIIELFQAEENLAIMKIKTKIGISRYIEKNRHWGPKIYFGKDYQNDKDLDAEKFKMRYLELREKKLSKRAIAKMLSMDIGTLYTRLYELGVQ